MKKVFIQIIGDSPPQSTLKKLNLSHKLSKIRDNNNNVINDMLLFSTKSSDGFAKIEYENEDEFNLKDIITFDNDQNILYLMKKQSWNIFNINCKLDYGRSISFDGIKKANKRAFIMEDCEITDINAEGYKKDKLVFESKEDWIKKTNLFFNTNINAHDFAELGLSFGSSQNENFNDEIMSTYKYTEVGKVSLKFSKYLKPTEEFIKAVGDSFNDPEKRKKIIEEYGQFIPTEVILGGRAYFKDVKTSLKNSVDKSKEGSASVSTGPLSVKAGGNTNNLKGTSTFYSFNYIRLLGGKHPDDKTFDEKAWIESLIDYQNWDCIEFKGHISIFQLLPEDLRKSSEKRIFYTCIEDCDYYLNEPGRYRDYDLKLPRNVLDVILSDSSDCDIFATVIDTEDSRDVVFNCQILKTENIKPVKPRIIIHGIQKRFQPRKFKLKIRIIVVGYDTNFNIFPNVKVVENCYRYDLQNPQSQCEFYNKALSFEYELMTRNIPFFGIPILGNLDSSNKFLVIGHSFCGSQDDKGLEIHVFSYNLKEGRYVKLPEFTFRTLVILDHLTSDTYGSLTFEFSVWKKKPFIDLKKNFISQPGDLNPKYISLLLKDNNYKPFFLNQKIKQIKIKYVSCNCGKTCFACKKTKKLSKDENKIECIIYNI